MSRSLSPIRYHWTVHNVFPGREHLQTYSFDNSSPKQNLPLRIATEKVLSNIKLYISIAFVTLFFFSETELFSRIYIKLLENYFLCI